MQLFVWVLATLLAVTAASSDKKVVCYYAGWAHYREGNGKFLVTDIDPTLCTHLVFSFYLPRSDGSLYTNDVANMDHFKSLRSKNPNVKLMVAIGGYTEGSARFSQIAASPELRKKFVQNVYNLMKEYNLDGFDVDWEYPTRNNGSPADKANYVQLLKELKQKFAPEGLLLSAAVAVTQWAAEQSYNIPEISKYLDFINLMAYDIHGSWEQNTGSHGALFAASWENDKNANIDAAIQYWIRSGAPAKKIVLGAPLYGKGWTIAGGSTKPGSAGAGPSQAGPYSKEPGTLYYNEICEKIKNEKWQVKFEDEQKVPYAFKNNQWVGYDDERSLANKAEYVNTKGLGGMMVWSIDNDDFKGICKGVKYPLLRTIHSAITGGAVSSPSEEPKPDVPNGEYDEDDDFYEQKSSQNQQNYEQEPENAQEPQGGNQQTQSQNEQNQQSQSPNASGDCQADGYIRDPQDSTVFYYCQTSFGEFVKHRFQCPSSLVYDTCLGVCNYADQAC